MGSGMPESHGTWRPFAMGPRRAFTASSTFTLARSRRPPRGRMRSPLGSAVPATSSRCACTAARRRAVAGLSVRRVSEPVPHPPPPANADAAPCTCGPAHECTKAQKTHLRAHASCCASPRAPEAVIKRDAPQRKTYELFHCFLHTQHCSLDCPSGARLPCAVHDRIVKEELLHRRVAQVELARDARHLRHVRIDNCVRANGLATRLRVHLDRKLVARADEGRRHGALQLDGDDFGRITHAHGQDVRNTAGRTQLRTVRSLIGIRR
eukprot:363715-Pleurochrysis_carterae.AAC.1